jgi:hypothetical protein
MWTSFEKFINESHEPKFTVYHRSNDYEHMVDNDFKLEYSHNENSVFGRAIYFASSPNISSQLGKYICKFKIKLDSPLDLNKEISNDEANKLLKIFLKKYNINNSYDFNEDYKGVQYGEFFLQIQDMIILEKNVNSYYKDFIQNELGLMNC